MIFITVGAQMAFDRLVRAIDRWAGERGRLDVFAQIGPAEFRPQNIGWTKFLDPAEFRQKVEGSSIVIAHAGMGSILTALELGRPILVMPRRGDLMETRNDHQVATAKRFEAQGRIAVAFDEEQLVRKLDHIGEFAAADRISSRASPRLLHAIRHFVRTGERPVVPAGRPVSVPRPAALVVRPAARTVVEPAVEVLAEALVG
jgi:UDP-N-acetylglucosamine transferase subunit ALG13